MPTVHKLIPRCLPRAGVGDFLKIGLVKINEIAKNAKIV